MRVEPLFLHSGFRTGSTWIWQKFREHENTVAFYEPFNEQLRHLALEDIENQKAISWRSRHPQQVGSYFEEYKPYIDSGGGIAGFPADFIEENFLLNRSKLGKQKNNEVVAYLKKFICPSIQSGRIPVLGCVRTLGSVDFLKNELGGIHVLVLRNVYLQWCSFSGQKRFGNEFFLSSFFNFIQSSDERIFKEISNYFMQDSANEFSQWVLPENSDRLFALFFTINAYLAIVSMKYCDYVIVLDKLYDDTGYRNFTEKFFCDSIRIDVDFSDVVKTIDFPLNLLSDPRQCRVIIDEACQLFLRDHFNMAEYQKFNLLLDASINESIQHRIYTSAVFEYIQNA